MKRIQSLHDCPEGLTAFLVDEGDEVKDWEGFRSRQAGASYLELIEILVETQHGLCGYCEIDIEARDRQVEHVIPQSDPLHGAAHALDHGNMIACCKGGTLLSDDDARRLDPVRRNRSCGEAKGDLVDADFIDPRTLPLLPSITRVNFDGRIEAYAAACDCCGILVDKVERTIQILGLNCERLRRARENRWNALSEYWASEIDNPELMEVAARGELLPDAQNRLPRFFTRAMVESGVRMS